MVGPWLFACVVMVLLVCSHRARLIAGLLACVGAMAVLMVLMVLTSLIEAGRALIRPTQRSRRTPRKPRSHA